jgi:hypothetical protein
MTELYWIDTIELDTELGRPPLDENGCREQAAQALKQLMQTTGMLPDWVDLIYWQSQFTSGTFLPIILEQAGFNRDRPAGFAFPDSTGYGQAVINAATRALAVKDTDVIIVGQQQENYCMAAVLISPKAVGRRSLSPIARLAYRAELNSAPADGKVLFTGIGGLLEMAGYETNQIGWLAVTNNLSRIQSDWRAAFPAAMWLPLIPGRPRGVLFRLGELVRALKDSARALGLLISQDEGESVQVTLIERM